MSKTFTMIAGENPASARLPERNDVPMVAFEYDREGQPLGFLVSQKTMRRERDIVILNPGVRYVCGNAITSPR